jgi:hypothetical protein
MGSLKQNFAYCVKGGDVRYKKGVDEVLKPKSNEDHWRELIHDAETLTAEEFKDKRPKDWVIRRQAIERMMIEEAGDRTETWDGELQHKNVWLWGATGLGKSRWASQLASPKNTLKKACNKWWCGYKLTKTTLGIIEDYPEKPQGDYLCHHLKLWSDRYAFIGETKGSSTMVEPGRFFLVITGNFKIEDCINAPENVEAIKRRFNVIEMTHENKPMVAQLRLDPLILTT